MKLPMLLAFLLLLTAAAPAQQKRPMTFDDLQAMKRVSDPQISPSGKWVLFSVTEVSLEDNTKINRLWSVPLVASTCKTRSGLSEARVTGVKPEDKGETGGRFSPDGKWVSYTQTVAGSSQIWMAPWDDVCGNITDVARQVTTLETQADGAIWAPDSKHILFVSNVYPECESHAPIGQQRNVEEKSCNALKDAAAAKSQVKALVFDHLLYRHWDSYVGAKHSHIFYGSVDGGGATDLTPASVIGDHEAPTFSLGGPMGYAISPDGKEVAYVTNLDKVPAASTNNDIFVLQVGAEPKTAKKVSTSPGSDDGPQYSPDGKWLAWRSQARNGLESDKFRLFVTDRSSGAIKDLMPKFDNWVDEFAWAPDSKDIYFASGVSGQEFVLKFELSNNSLVSINENEPNGEFSGIQISPSGKTLISTKTKVNEPSDVIAFSLDEMTPKIVDPAVPKNKEQAKRFEDSYAASGVPEFFHDAKLTSFNDRLLSALDLHELEPFWFKGAEGTQVEGFVVKPPNFDPAKKYPVKFLMHGGPQTAWGDAWSYRWNWELMAANGYVVVGINRRGSTGYGQKFVDEVSGDWGGRAYVDLMKGLDYAEVKFPFIDKNRECALGASYGGFMANWVLTHTDRFKCIVTHDGMFNPQSAYGTTEELWFNEWEFRPTTADGMVEKTKPAHPWDFVNATNQADPFRKWSPMLHIKDAHTPTLVIHSQRDYRLDVSEGFQLFTALQRLGVPSKMLYFPDEGHWVLKPQNSQLWYETVNDWCDRWLGMNKYAGVGPETNPMAGRVQGPGPRVQKAAATKVSAADKTDK